MEASCSSDASFSFLCCTAVHILGLGQLSRRVARSNVSLVRWERMYTGRPSHVCLCSAFGVSECQMLHQAALWASQGGGGGRSSLPVNRISLCLD